MISQRVFKRLDLAHLSKRTYDDVNHCATLEQPASYFLDCFARHQWNNKNPCISRQYVYTGTYNPVYDFDYICRYFMKPYKVTVFEHTSEALMARPKLLVCGWLFGTDIMNRVIVTIDRVCPTNDSMYIQSVINCKWKPASVEQWNQIEQSNTFTQTHSIHANVEMA